MRIRKVGVVEVEFALSLLVLDAADARLGGVEDELRTGKPSATSASEGLIICKVVSDSPIGIRMTSGRRLELTLAGRFHAFQCKHGM